MAQTVHNENGEELVSMCPDEYKKLVEKGNLLLQELRASTPLLTINTQQEREQVRRNFALLERYSSDMWS